jgi:membrane fusion protein
MSIIEKPRPQPPLQLFRSDALEYQRARREWGDVAYLQPISTKVTSWLLVLLTVITFGFLSFAPYARKETASGYLTPTKGTAKIFAPRGGTITEVHVVEGVLVGQGQPVLTIRTDQISADGLDVHATLMANLVSLRNQLTNNIKQEEERLNSERARLQSLVNGLQQEIGEYQEQIKLQSERLKILEAELSSADQLRSKGHMTTVEVGRRQLALFEQQQISGSLRQQLTSKQNQLNETRFSLEQLPTLMAQKVQSIRTELSGTEQRIAEVNARSAYVIRAPASGRVTTVQAKVGHGTDSGRLQLEIIPEDSVLQAELFVPARAIGFVELGQSVRILYDAFPYQHFGTYSGKVIKISKTILTSSDAIGPLKLAEPAYRVTAELDQQDVKADSKTFMLQPDMLLKADIILEQRSLLSWLLAPLRSVRM